MNSSCWVVLISRNCYVYFPFPEAKMCVNTTTISKPRHLLYHVLEIESVRGLRPQIVNFHMYFEFSYTVKSNINVKILHEFTLIMNTTCLLFVTDIINEAISSRLAASRSRNLVQDLSQRISIFVDEHTTAYEYLIPSLKCTIEVVTIHD